MLKVMEQIAFIYLKIAISKKHGYGSYRPEYFKNRCTSFVIFRQAGPTGISRDDGVNYELILTERMQKLRVSIARNSYFQ